MSGRSVLLVAAAAMALGGIGAVANAQTVQPCANLASCVQVGVGTASGNVGDTVSVPVTFQQAPSDGNAGGPDEIAALAMTIGLGGSSGSPALTLADCTLNADGLPASVVPAAALSGFKLVVENASCAGGRTHCLCPDAGQTLDNFINLVVYGPNPLPTPGPSGVTIPTLPNGQLATLNLKIQPGQSGTVPLHVYNHAVSGDASHPQFTALLSVGDKLAVDQTCSPLAVPGTTPPCAASSSVSQVAVTDGSVTVSGGVCAGDCNGDHMVTVNEIIVLVNITLGNSQPSACPNGVPSGSDVNVALIIQAVNHALNGCGAGA